MLWYAKIFSENICSKLYILVTIIICCLGQCMTNQGNVFNNILQANEYVQLHILYIQRISL